MLTIRQFAQLVGCHTQTLRYYDRIGLLPPARVDEWTGYRFYEPGQAALFVRIKNLQLAEFSIQEIKSLLLRSDEEVYKAFDRKIEEQTRKMAKIREIQRTYLSEKQKMEEIIGKLSGFLQRQLLSSKEQAAYFGLSEEEVVSLVREWAGQMEQWREEENFSPEASLVREGQEEIKDFDEVLAALENLADGDALGTLSFTNSHLPEADEEQKPYVQVWAHSGFSTVAEFIDTIPPLQDGGSYRAVLTLTETNEHIGVFFPLLMASALLSRARGAQVNVECTVEESSDGVNHFSLWQA